VTGSPPVGLRERHKLGRVRRILDATRSLLRERSDESPSVERIAERAEVAPATVFNLVGTRDRIWAALADELLDEVEQRMAALPDLDPRDRARALAAITVDLICADPAVYRHVLSSWRRSGRLLSRSPVPHLVHSLRAGAAAGTLREDLDFSLLADVVSAACTGAAHQWAAEMIDDQAFRTLCLAAVDVAFTAAVRS
jgi:AcrR family transcriptional regulator